MGWQQWESQAKRTACHLMRIKKENVETVIYTMAVRRDSSPVADETDKLIA